MNFNQTATNCLFAVAYCLLIACAFILSSAALAMFMVARLFLTLTDKIESKNTPPAEAPEETTTSSAASNPQPQPQNNENECQLSTEISPTFEETHQKIIQTEQEIANSTNESSSQKLEDNAYTETLLTTIEHHLYPVPEKTWKQFIIDELKKHQHLQDSEPCNTETPQTTQPPISETSEKTPDNNTNLIKLITQLKQQKKSLKQIADQLNKSPEFCKSGKWYPSKITKLLKSA